MAGPRFSPCQAPPKPAPRCSPALAARCELAFHLPDACAIPPTAGCPGSPRAAALQGLNPGLSVQFSPAEACPAGAQGTRGTQAKAGVPAPPSASGRANVTLLSPTVRDSARPWMRLRTRDSQPSTHKPLPGAPFSRSPACRQVLQGRPQSTGSPSPPNLTRQPQECCGRQKPGGLASPGAGGPALCPSLDLLLRCWVEPRPHACSRAATPGPRPHTACCGSDVTSVCPPTVMLRGGGPEEMGLVGNPWVVRDPPSEGLSLFSWDPEFILTEAAPGPSLLQLPGSRVLACCCPSPGHDVICLDVTQLGWPSAGVALTRAGAVFLDF